MGKSVADAVLDAALNEIKNNVAALHICSAEPTNYTEATSTYDLGDKTPPAFTGPANGDTNGRKLTIDAITDGSVTATGTADHVALVTATVLYYVTTLSSSQSVTSGNTFTLTAWDIEIADPT